MQNTVIDIIKRRRSVRDYSSDQIKQEELETILDAALYAPFGGGETQDILFTVVQERETLEKINALAKEAAKKSELEWFKDLGNDEKFNCLYNAPTLIILSGNKASMCPEPDASMAVQNILLAAESLGLGSCCLYFPLMAFGQDSKGELSKELSITEEYKPVFSLIIGYKNKTENEAPKKRAGKIIYIK